MMKPMGRVLRRFQALAFRGLVLRVWIVAVVVLGPGLILLYTTAIAASPIPRMAPSPAVSSVLVRLRATWVDDLEHKHLDEAMDLYTEDAVFFNPGGPRTDGKAAIRALFDTVMKAYDSDIELRSTSVAMSGNLAYDSGDYDETITDRATKARKMDRGNYLMVLKRGTDGHWSIAQHMWTEIAAAK